MDDVTSNWKRIERWLQANAPEILAEFEGPATQGMLDKAAAAVGRLPDDYAELLGIHDGVEASDYGAGTFGGFVLYSLREALDVRKMMQDVRQSNADLGDMDSDMQPDPGVRRHFWHDAWLPLAVRAGDPRTMIFLDLDPAPGGARGQLVRHVADMSTLPVVARSTAEWLAGIAGKMESGRVIVEREPGGDDEDDELIRLLWSVDDDA